MRTGRLDPVIKFPRAKEASGHPGQIRGSARKARIRTAKLFGYPPPFRTDEVWRNISGNDFEKNQDKHQRELRNSRGGY